MKKKAWLSWSTGKDSAYSLYKLQSNNHIEVESLLTTVTADYQRVSMHATRLECLRMQAESLSLPLVTVEIPAQCNNEIYERNFLAALQKAKNNGVKSIAYGDLYLEDIKFYREKMHQGIALEAMFPIWQTNTKLLAREIVDLGFEAFITCVDPKKLPKSFAGRKYDHSFLDDLPDAIDPCGENGEFHSFVFNGPNFKNSIPVKLTEIVERDGFIFADIVVH